MNNDEQMIADELMTLVMQRVFTRIAPQFTEEEMVKIEALNQDSNNEALREFMLSKVPEFDDIVREEIEIVKSDLQKQPAAA